MSVHDDDTIGQILTRRQALCLLGGTVIAGGVLGPARVWAALPTTRPREPLIATPAQTPGPFFNDEKLHRADIRGTDRPGVADAPALALTFAVYRLADGAYTPMPGVTVDLWCCDALGVYSGEARQASGQDTTGQTWLRGFQRTDEQGLANFTAIVPGWYPGRTPHLHFMVRPPADGPERYFASQLYFDETQLAPIYQHSAYAGRDNSPLTNDRDGIYQRPLEDGTPSGDALRLDLEVQGDGFAAAVPILLTDESMRRLRR